MPKSELGRTLIEQCCHENEGVEIAIRALHLSAEGGLCPPKEEHDLSNMSKQWYRALHYCLHKNVGIHCNSGYAQRRNVFQLLLKRIFGESG